MKILVVSCLLLVVSLGPAWSQAVAPDPTRLSVGGRILGMGKAFVGLTDDLGALYTNPAGLGQIERWQMTSMSGTFMEDFAYLNLSGAYPTNLGVFGIGFTSSGIGGGYATTIEADSDPRDRIYKKDPTKAEFSYYNNVFILSYGNKLQNLRLPFKIPFESLVGTNLKLFFSGITGIEGATARGYELDLGVLLKPRPWLSFGSTLQNLLPTSLGGKLTYDTGHTEGYPAIWENGLCLKILGEEDALRKLGAHDLKFLLDADYYPTRQNFPILLHYGFEWFPMKMLAIRMGIDQDAMGDGTGTSLVAANNFTAGVGLNVRGFRFDYAYHQFAGAPGITNNFFSLSYGIEPPKKVPVAVQISEPKDKTLTFDEKIKTAGRVLDPGIRTLKINDNPVKFTLRGDFETISDLKIGKNKLVLSGLNELGKEVASEKIRILRLKPFPDVLITHWAREPISVIAMAGVVSGYPDGTFKPEGNITRAEMCTLLMKSRPTTYDLRPTTKFTDVSEKHWAAGYITQASELGVVKGYPDESFKPNGLITRAEGLSMITRFAKVSEEVYAKQFPDVASEHWAAKIIAGAYKAGLLKYLEDKPFVPSQRLTRAEAVEMLYRTEYVQSILKKDLLNWEAY